MTAEGNGWAMRVNRRLLYWGVFMAAAGGVLVVADVSAVDTAIIADALRLWPLAIVAIGVGLVLRPTSLSLAGGMLAAAAPGLVIGAGFALAPRIALDCGAVRAPSIVTAQDGAFDGPARVSVAIGCGALEMDTAPGDGWRVETRSVGSRTPLIESSGRSLSIEAGGNQGWRRFDAERDAWRLTLPTTPIEDLSLVVNAGDGRVRLPDAAIDHLDLTTNAGRTTVDLSDASVTSLSGTLNAGMLSVRLPATGDLVGSLEVNAGSLQVCAPSGLGLRVRHTGSLSGFSVNGDHQSGTDWQSPDYASATSHADLTIDVNLGNVEIDPIGGCK